MAQIYADGSFKPRSLRCQGHDQMFATFTENLGGGNVIVEVLGCKAQVSREEIAALAALFPVKGRPYTPSSYERMAMEIDAKHHNSPAK